MRGKSPSSEPSGKTISSLFGVKTCKSKIQFEQHFFSNQKNPKQPTPLKFPEKKNLAHPALTKWYQALL
jgi:hypothetical protein